MGDAKIPIDWDEESYCCFAVQWPNSPEWLSVLRGVLTIPGGGYFWDETTGVVIDAVRAIRQTYDTNLHLEEILMACNSDQIIAIATALNNIANNLGGTSGQCCGTSGSGGSGQSSPPPSPNEQGNPLSDPPPEGFETWEEFYHDKCAIAHDIMTKLKQDIGEMALINFAEISVASLITVLTIALATPIPFDDIAAIAGLLLSIAAEIVITTTLSYLNDNTEDLICDLYNGTNSSSSRDLFLSRFNDLVDVGTADPLEAYSVKALMAYMLDVSVTNRLYTKDNTRNWLTEDCSECNECILFLAQPASGPLVGTTLSDETINSVVAEAGDYTDRERYDGGVFFNSSAVCTPCGDMVKATVTLLTGVIDSGPDATTPGWYAYNAACETIYFDASVPPSGICCQGVGSVSASAHTFEVTLEECD